MNNGKLVKIFTIISSISILIMLLFLIYRQVEERYVQQDDVLIRLRNKCASVFPEEMKKIKLYKGDKSYTINKEKVYLCMKDQNGTYYNDHILMHVLLHEIAHTKCPEIGHTELFQEIFRELMYKAEAEGIYDINEEIPNDYCSF